MRTRWPKARFVNVAAPLPLSLLQNCSLTDACIPHPKNWKGTLRAVAAVRREKPDLAVCLSGSRRVALMAQMCGAPVRAGFTPTKHEAALTIRVPKSGPPAPQHDLRVAEALGCTPQQRDYIGLLDLSHQERETASRWLHEHDLGDFDGVLLGLNMGASIPRRRWGVENFARVVSELEPEPGAKLGARVRWIAFGALDDRAAISQLQAQTSVPLLSAAGELSPRETAALMERCALLLTNDSGPMHLSIAVGTPVVALFGPVPASYRLPVGGLDIGLQCNAACQALPKPRCKYEDSCPCLRAIAPKDVLEAVEKLLVPTTQESAKT